MNHPCPIPGCPNEAPKTQLYCDAHEEELVVNEKPKKPTEPCPSCGKIGCFHQVCWPDYD